MAHFSATENIWVPDGQAASLQNKNDTGKYFWPHTNTWTTGNNTQSARAIPSDGKAYFCQRTNQWTVGSC